VNGLLQFTSPNGNRWQNLSILDLIDEVCDLFAPQIRAQGIHLDLDVCQSHQLYADRCMLQQALENLVLNALDAMPDGGELSFTSYCGPEGVELEIADTGCGVPDTIRRRLFNPFVTTKRDGAGLGLAIVHRVVTAHGGDVSLKDCPQGGTAFTLRFPFKSRKAAA
jgi:signal transduction histidine kinase